MKLLSFLLLIPVLSLNAQTTNVGGIATPPDVTTALNSYLLTQIATSAPSLTSLTAGDASMTLPQPISSACVETYSVTTISSASNVSTLGVATVSVPLGTQITISGATTAQYNAVFTTTSAPSSSSGLTISLGIANGSYSNSNPSTNGYPVLSWNHCTILIDNEAVEVNGTSDGVTYSIVRGTLGTTAAAHAQGASLQLLKDANLRAWYRANNRDIVRTIIDRVGTPRINTLTAQKTALDAQIAAIRAALGL
jgi:hypothetical protein